MEQVAPQEEVADQQQLGRGRPLRRTQKFQGELPACSRSPRTEWKSQTPPRITWILCPLRSLERSKARCRSRRLRRRSTLRS